MNKANQYLSKRIAREHYLKGKYYYMVVLLFILLGSAALILLNKQKFYFFGQIQICQTGGQLYSDSSPYGDCSLACRCSAIQPTNLECVEKITLGRLFLAKNSYQLLT